MSDYYIVEIEDPINKIINECLLQSQTLQGQNISKILISPNENFIVAVSYQCLTLYITNSKNDDKQVVKNEEIDLVSYLAWNDTSSELYFGNEFGLLSVIIPCFSLSSLFENPLTTIIQLESKILQIDTYRNFLIVSTLIYVYGIDLIENRCWELRIKADSDAECGACFCFSKNNSNTICCAKYDLCLMYIQFNGFLKTEQYFNENPLTIQRNILKISNDFNCRLPNENLNDFELDDQKIEYSLLQFVNENLLISYKKKYFVLIDVNKTRIIAYKKFDSYIKQLKIINNNLIYIQTEQSINIFRVETIEKFIKKSISQKQFLLALDFCSNCLDNSNVHKQFFYNYVVHLKNKIEIDNDFIKKFDKTSILNKNILFPKIEKNTEKYKNLFNMYIKNISMNSGKLYLFLEEYKNCRDFVDFLKKFLKYYENHSEIKELTVWSSKIFFKYIDVVLLVKAENKQISEFTDDFIKIKIRNDFFEINKQYANDNSCNNCSFPLPININNYPVYFEIISKVIDSNFETDINYCSSICNRVPYIWAHFLLKLKNIPNNFLKCALQIDQPDLLDYLKLCYSWDDILAFFVQLNLGFCLSCNSLLSRKIVNLNWENIGKLILKDIGPLQTVQLLSKYADQIPKGCFSLSFYQCCLKTT